MTPSYSTTDDADDDLAVEVTSPYSSTASFKTTQQQRVEKIDADIEKLTIEVQKIKSSRV